MDSDLEESLLSDFDSTVESQEDDSEDHESDSQKKPTLGCKHYERHCLFVSPCCEKLFPCRLYHDETVVSHNLDRFAVTEIVCAACNLKQLVSEKCTGCGVLFGKYFCSICRLYDDKDKGQFHCNGCGICRVGGQDNFTHCYGCGMCLTKSIIETHKCIEANSKRNCPICLEYIHTSRVYVHVPDCGHLMHMKCYKMLLKMGDFRCPTCGISLGKMEDYWKLLDKEIEETPMPEEYAATKAWILCKDCHAVSQVKFHILGLKCSCCGSYNTCGSDAPTPQETEV